ncbi:hypothetical protein [Nonomuraea rubra]|uniref:hypothetical protein n=1 Tax=Nonomuraea rubra TaxID=46180 RepID=UPI00340E769D
MIGEQGQCRDRAGGGHRTHDPAVADHLGQGDGGERSGGLVGDREQGDPAGQAGVGGGAVPFGEQVRQGDRADAEADPEEQDASDRARQAGSDDRQEQRACALQGEDARGDRRGGPAATGAADQRRTSGGAGRW